MPLPKGTRIGGRQKGTPNRMTAERRIQIEKSGLTPLDFLLSVMRDATVNIDRRMQAAVAAAPYVHPRLSSVQTTVAHKDDIDDFTTEELVAIARGSGSLRH